MDLTINGSLFLTGILNMVGGAGTFIQHAVNADAEAVLMIFGWTTDQQGREWFNTDTAQWEGWNGINRVILG